MAFHTAISKATLLLFLVVVFSLGFMKPSLEIWFVDLTITDLLFPFFLLSWVIALATRTLCLKWRVEYWAFVVFFAAMLVSAIASENQDLSFRRVVGVLYLILLAVAASSIAGSVATLRLSVLAWLAGSALPLAVAAIAIALFYTAPGTTLLRYITYHQGASPFAGLPRVSSTSVSATMFCNYLTVTLVLTLVADRLGWVRRRVAMVLGLSVSLAAAFTVSIALGGIFLAAGLWIWKTAPRPSLRRIGLATGSLIAVGFLVIAPLSLSGFALNDLEPSARLLVWQQSIGTFLQHPVVGKGVGLGAASLTVQNNDGSWSILTDAHNTFLNVAATGGIVGLAAVIGLIAVLLRTAAAAGRAPETRGVLISGLGTAFITAFVYQGLTSSFEDARHLWVLMGFVIAAAGIGREHGEGAATPI